MAVTPFVCMCYLTKSLHSILFILAESLQSILFILAFIPFFNTINCNRSLPVPGKCISPIFVAPRIQNLMDNRACSI
jgi:hypothetical protein